jgi:hypothetical protein
MALTFRTIIIGVAVLGIGMGVAFGAGVAYGRGDPKTVQSGLTQQQLQSLLGVSGAGATGGQAVGQGGTGSQGAGQGGAAAALTRNPSGRITAIDGQTLTIETRTGPLKVNVSPTTKINKLAAGAASDLSADGTVIVSGTRRPDGSFDATEISQVPPELQALLGGTGGASAAPGAASTPQTGGR